MFQSFSNLIKVINALVSSRFYGNALFTRLNQSCLHCLQMVQNATRQTSEIRGSGI